MMSDNSSSVAIQCPQYNSAQTHQLLGSIDHQSGSIAGPYPAVNHAYANGFPPARYPDTTWYDDPSLATRPGEPQLTGHPATGATHLVPIVPIPAQSDFYAPAPGIVHSGMSIIEDLKSFAIRHIHDPGSHVDKLRMKRSRSGAVKVLIWLAVPNFSGPPQLGYEAPAIPEVFHAGPRSHMPLHHSVARSPGSSSIGYSIHSGMSVTENIKDLAIRYLHNLRTRVGKLRMRQSDPGSFKVLIVLEIDDTTT